jgi:hypothetical protein
MRSLGHMMSPSKGMIQRIHFQRDPTSAAATRRGDASLKGFREGNHLRRDDNACPMETGKHGKETLRPE